MDTCRRPAPSRRRWPRPLRGFMPGAQMGGSGSSHPPSQPQGLTRLTEGRTHSGQEEAATSKGPAASWGAFFTAVRPGPGGHGPRPPGRPAQGRLSLAVCPSGHTGSSISYPPLSSIFQEWKQGNRERRACARAAADPSCSGGRGGVAGSGASPRSRGWVRGPPRPRGWVRGAAGSGASPPPRGGAERGQNSSLGSPDPRLLA